MFFFERVFGHRGRQLVEHDRKRLRSRQDESGPTPVDSLQRSITQLKARQARLLHTRKTNDDSNGIVLQQISGHTKEPEAERLLKLERLRVVRETHRQVDSSALDLLNALLLAQYGLALVPANPAEEGVRGVPPLSPLQPHPEVGALPSEDRWRLRRAPDDQAEAALHGSAVADRAL